MSDESRTRPPPCDSSQISVEHDTAPVNRPLKPDKSAHGLRIDNHDLQLSNVDIRKPIVIDDVVGQMFVLDDMLGLRVRVTVGACADLEGTVIGQESKSRFLIQIDAGQCGIYLVCESSNLERSE